MLHSTHRVHDRQVNGSTQVDQVRLGEVLNTLLVGRDCVILVILVLIIRLCVRTGRLAVRVTKDLSLDLLVALLVFDELGVNLEKICRSAWLYVSLKLTQSFLDCQLVIQSDPMRNLLFLLNKIQSLWNSRVVLVLVLSNLEQHLNHVLTTLVERTLVQDGSEALVDTVVRFR